MEPKLAVLMLSWLRFETLLATLRQIPSTTSVPLHLCLRVQGSERLSVEEREEVIRASAGFTTRDIYFTRDNIGTAAARLDLIHRGTKAGYEYLMFTDDDIHFPTGGIDHQVSVLDRYPEIGSVSLRPRGINKVQLVRPDGNVDLKTYDDVDKTLVEVYLIGSASIMFRSELYRDHLAAPDPAYYIGTWDWDFVLQIREAGYKVTVITDKEIINKRGGNEEYRKKRRNKRYVVENRRLFVDKWGFDPIKSRRFNSNFTKPVDAKDKLIRREKILQEIDTEFPIVPERIFITDENIIVGTDWRARMGR